MTASRYDYNYDAIQDSTQYCWAINITLNCTMIQFKTRLGAAERVNDSTNVACFQVEDIWELQSQKIIDGDHTLIGFGMSRGTSCWWRSHTLWWPSQLYLVEYDRKVCGSTMIGSVMSRGTRWR